MRISIGTVNIDESFNGGHPVISMNSTMLRTGLLFVILALLNQNNNDVFASKSCDCACNSGGVSLDNLDPVTQEKVNNITKELKVDTRNTSSHTRTLISAPDPRPSAQAAGYIGIIILTIVFGSLVLLDLTRICFRPNAKYMD